MTKSPVPAFKTIAALLALAMLGNGQSASPKTHFESASIHPAAVAPRDGVPRPIFDGGPGRLRFRNVTLKALLIQSLAIKPYQLKAPAWMDDLRYDLNATMPVGTPQQQVRDMVSNLLKERFALEWHQQPAKTKCYALTVSKSGIKMKAVSASIPSVAVARNGSFAAKSMQMGGFADFLAQILERPVIDLTGLTESFDIAFNWDAGGAGDSPAPSAADSVIPVRTFSSLFVALKDGLGLNVATVERVIPITVIDGARKVPDSD